MGMHFPGAIWMLWLAVVVCYVLAWWLIFRLLARVAVANPEPPPAPPEPSGATGDNDAR